MDAIWKTLTRTTTYDALNENRIENENIGKYSWHKVTWAPYVLDNPRVSL